MEETLQCYFGVAMLSAARTRSNQSYAPFKTSPVFVLFISVDRDVERDQYEC